VRQGKEGDLCGEESPYPTINGLCGGIHRTILRDLSFLEHPLEKRDSPKGRGIMRREAICMERI
jgi:hypothetical protein